MTERMIDLIKSPEDLRKLNIEQLNVLTEEIRRIIIETVSRTGGHLASNLGTIELTIALHYALNTPHDRLIWDVGHQVYTHKILTGRCTDLSDGLRQYQGCAGFPKKSESDHDHYDTGHSGTSISFALGMAEAARMQNREDRVVAIIGDGSMTAGVAFEGLNQSGQLKNENLIVVLNDNEMSISPNVGALSSYISRQMISPRPAHVRKLLKNLLQSIPRAGDDLVRLVQRVERSIKELFQPGLLFEELGFQYLGPFDGHRLDGLVYLFKNIRNLPGPLLVHVLTKKGNGYKPAELEPERFHGASPFDIQTGDFKKKPGAPSFTSVFGDALVDLARNDDRVVAITAAMTLGTGLTRFAREIPERFFDVGIAEQHAVTFAGGLAQENLRPVVAIYSTFLQRAYDMIFHDVCLQKLPVVFALDRGGLVGADGPTHHGVFDLSYLRHLPEMVVMVPRNEVELRTALFSAITYDRPSAIRYPRGNGQGIPFPKQMETIPLGQSEMLRPGRDVTILGVGPLLYDALAVAAELEVEGIEVEVIDARFVKPLDETQILESVKKTGRLLTLEENARQGGFGSAVLELLADHSVDVLSVCVMGIPDEFVPMGSQNQLRDDLELNPNGIRKKIVMMMNHDGEESSGIHHDVSQLIDELSTSRPAVNPKKRR